MDVVIFKELTTDEHLKQLKLESEKYTGLYVDMEDKKQRKYVKDKAADIKTLIAKIERRRIDTVAEYKIDVEKEAASITEDLVIANLPFTLLIDEYAVSRKAILDKEKARKLAVELAVKLDGDHEFGLLMNSQFDTDKINAERERIAYDLAVQLEAEKAAEEKAKLLAQQAIDDAQAEKQKAIDDKAKADADLIAAQAREKLLNEQAEKTRLNNEWLNYISEAYEYNEKLNAEARLKYQQGLAEVSRLAAIETERLAGIERQQLEVANKKATQDKLEANKKHVGMVRGEIKSHIMSACNVDEDLAVKIVKSLLKTDRITINY